MEIIKKKIDFNISVFEILVLSALANKDADENEIHDFLLESSDKRINISTDTIRNILNESLSKKNVAKYNKPSSEKPQRVCYQLTGFGEVRLNRLLHYYYVNDTVIKQTINTLTKILD